MSGHDGQPNTTPGGPAPARLVKAIRRRALTAAIAAIRSRGYDVVWRDFYSPLPAVDDLGDLWSAARGTPGVDLRLDEAAALLRSLRPHVEEFDPPLEPDEAGSTGSFHLRNGLYQSIDAEVLYGLLRHLRPRLVLELGSGASSHVIDCAARANARDGDGFAHEIVDPFPFSNGMGTVDAAVVHRLPAEKLDPGEVERLEPGDVLFVDTTHTVKTGGDVVHIVLNLLPRVRPGVYVHLHDIFLPDEYPQDWVVDERRAWAEQYLLQAFLAFNPSFEVVLPAYALARYRPEVVADVIPSSGPAVTPGAFWLRRVS